MSEPLSPPTPDHDRHSRTLLLGLLLFAAAYLLPGLVGHDPWKQDEAYSFGIIYNMYLTGDLVVPTLAADPFMEKPPAYYISATGMLHLLDGWLPLHDAARLTTAAYLGIAFLFTGFLARATWGAGYGPLGVLLLMSSLGLLQYSHTMITDTALAAGMAMGFYGLLRARESFGWGGVWLGTGAGLAFLSKGLLGPGILGVGALLLPVLERHLTMDFEPTWQMGAFLVALVLQIGWIWMLVRFRPSRSGTGADPLLLWPAGLILTWGLMATLHLPWLDRGKSYRPVFAELEQAMPAEYNCVADLEPMRLRESERGMLHYVAGITTEHVARPQDTACDLVLVEARVRVHGTDIDLGPGWEKTWQGRRPGDRRDLFVLFRRLDSKG